MIEKKRKRPNREILFYISFSDMMSLLMAFFVLLFSMSTLDTEKFSKLSASFTSIFNKQQMETQYAEEERILAKLYKDLSLYIALHQLQDQVAVKVENHALVMDLGSKMLFPVASADLYPEAKSILSAFIQYFVKVSEAKIVVEGHTDDTPIHTSEFASNWELSAARAASVVHFLSENGIKEENCYIIGYNQFRSLAPNDSEANRAKNRRVRIVFQPVVSESNMGNMTGKVIINEDSKTEILEATQNAVQDATLFEFRRKGVAK